jgi:hypothetical protein
MQKDGFSFLVRELSLSSDFRLTSEWETRVRWIASIVEAALLLRQVGLHLNSYFRHTTLSQQLPSTGACLPNMHVLVRAI